MTSPSDMTRAAIDGSGTERARCVLAPNPSPMTLDGTNTWLIAEPGSAAAIVDRPGPAGRGAPAPGRATGRRAGGAADRRRSCSPTGTRTTPRRRRRLAELTGAPVRAVDPAQRLGDEGLAAGDVLTAAGCELRVVATPGPHRRLGLPVPARRRRGADRRHRARPRHHGDRQRRQPGRLPGLAATGCGRWPTTTELRALLPGPRPDAGRRRPGPWTTTSPTARSGWPRSGRARGRATAPPAQIVARVYADVDRGAVAAAPSVGARPARLPGRPRANCRPG